MNRLIVLALPALLAGCTYKNATLPPADIPFASADYKVMGEVTAEDCGIYVLFIDAGHLFSNGGKASVASGGSILGMLSLGGAAPEVDRALYKALDKMPEATNLYAPRVHVKVTGLAPYGVPFVGSRCANVTAHGVQLGKGPVPNAN